MICLFYVPPYFSQLLAIYINKSSTMPFKKIQKVADNEDSLLACKWPAKPVKGFLNKAIKSWGREEVPMEGGSSREALPSRLSSHDLGSRTASHRISLQKRLAACPAGSSRDARWPLGSARPWPLLSSPWGRKGQPGGC